MHGISVKIRSEEAATSGSRLILRSYARAMEATATEQDGFAELMTHAPFVEIVPPAEQRPVLRTLWEGKTPKLRPALQTVTYQGQTYQITDPKSAPWIHGPVEPRRLHTGGVGRSGFRGYFQVLLFESFLKLR